MKPIYDDDYHKKRRAIDEKHRRKFGVMPRVEIPAPPPKPVAIVKPDKPPEQPKVEQPKSESKDSLLLAFIRSELVAVIGDAELATMTEKDVLEWFKEDFRNLLQVYQCLVDTFEKRGCDDNQKAVVWFVKQFPQLLPAWLAAQEKVADRGSKLRRKASASN